MSNISPDGQAVARSAVAGLVDGNVDARQQSRLQTMRRMATALLLAMVAVFIYARTHLGLHPAWAYVAAFAEAAMVGAMADWFAVVALFRRPLGLPIWHTAIIPQSKDEIARNLGQFVESHFVTTEAVVTLVRSQEPAAKLSQWLLQPANRQTLSRMASALVTRVLAAVDDQRAREIVRRLLTGRLSNLDLAGPVADFGFDQVKERRHAELFDWATRIFRDWLAKEEDADKAIAVLLDTVIDNKLLSVFKGTIATRLRTGLLTYTQAALDDPDHALRQRYDAYIKDNLVRLKTDPEFAARLRQFQLATLASEALQTAMGGLWDEFRQWLEKDLAEPDSTLLTHLDNITSQLASSLAANPATRTWINESLVNSLVPLITANRGKVAAFIQAQIDAWSKEEMTARIELAVGRDLQFIRVNGTIVGGVFGLLIYLVMHLLG